MTKAPPSDSEATQRASGAGGATQRASSDAAASKPAQLVALR